MKIELSEDAMGALKNITLSMERLKLSFDEAKEIAEKQLIELRESNVMTKELLADIYKNKENKYGPWWKTGSRLL